MTMRMDLIVDRLARSLDRAHGIRRRIFADPVVPDDWVNPDFAGAAARLRALPTPLIGAAVREIVRGILPPDARDLLTGVPLDPVSRWNTVSLAAFAARYLDQAVDREWRREVQQVRAEGARLVAEATGWATRDNGAPPSTIPNGGWAPTEDVVGVLDALSAAAAALPEDGQDSASWERAAEILARFHAFAADLAHDRPVGTHIVARARWVLGQSAPEAFARTEAARILADARQWRGDAALLAVLRAFDEATRALSRDDGAALAEELLRQLWLLEGRFRGRPSMVGGVDVGLSHEVERAWAVLGERPAPEPAPTPTIPIAERLVPPAPDGHRWVGPIPAGIASSGGDEDWLGPDAPATVPAAWLLRPVPARGWREFQGWRPYPRECEWVTASARRFLVHTVEGWWVLLPVRRSALGDALAERATAEGVRLQGLRPDEGLDEWAPADHIAVGRCPHGRGRAIADCCPAT